MSNILSTPINSAAVQIEGRTESNTLHLRGHDDLNGNENVISAAGMVAIMATLSTYWSGLSATKLAALTAGANGVWMRASTADVQALVLAADHATVAASLQTNLRTAGNTARG